MGQEGVDFDKDIKPLLGNPAVISATDVTSFLSDTADSGFVAALQVKDKDALDSLVEKTGAKKQGEVAGATVYQDRDTSFAVNDDMVVLAGSRELLEPRSSAPTPVTGCPRATSTRGSRACPRTPSRGSTWTCRACSARATAKSARKIPWVAALRTLGLTVSARTSRSTSSSTCAPRADLSD